MSEVINKLKGALELKKSNIGFSYTITIKDIEEVIKEYNELLQENKQLKEKLKNKSKKIDKALKYIDEFTGYYADDDGTAMFVIEELKEETFVKDLFQILGDE